jgi:predicted dehydrogenase
MKDGTRPNRREFLGLSAALAASGAMLPQGLFSSTESGRPVRLGFVGVGGRGSYLLRTALDIGGVEVPAICDINQQNLDRSIRLVERRGLPKPTGYSRGPVDYRRMVESEELDAVINATPMELHTPVMVAAMEAGCYGATEVPVAITEDECWELVETAERTGRQCMMLENYCYFRNVTMVLNMVNAGLFGDLAHCETGYQHDTRYVVFGPDGELLWRAQHKMTRNGNLYPTHALGPAAWWLGLGRGDRMDHLVSMSSRGGLGLKHYAVEKFGADSHAAHQTYTQGDVNTTLIRTEKGRTITLYYDTTLPRPFQMIYRLQGTKGIYSGDMEKVFFEGLSPRAHQWEDESVYSEKYDHPMWKTLGDKAEGYSHGGGDYMMIYQFLAAVRAGLPTPIDVYDSAAWSVISPLSEKSTAMRSRTVDIPDFSRGKWKEERELSFPGIEM